MEHQASTQIDKASSRYSKLDWPTQAMLVAAHRARADALRGMVVSITKRAKRVFAAMRVANSPQLRGQIARR